VIVVDASALAAFVLKEEGWRRLAKYLAHAVSVDHVVKEAVNAIWRATYLRKLITVNEAYKAYTLLMSLIGRNILVEHELKYIEKALEISLSHGLSLYDSLYIALALEKSLPLLTLDALQRKVAKRIGIETKPS